MKIFLPLILLAYPALAESSVSVTFSPHGGSTEAVVQLIQSAERSVHLAAYTFTSRPIAAALVTAHDRGVDVEAVLDRSNATGRYSQAAELAAAGIPIRIDYRYAIMHSKYIIVDGQTVECGSFNYTAAAERSNAEAVVVLRYNPDVARRFEANWTMLWNESVDYDK